MKDSLKTHSNTTAPAALIACLMGSVFLAPIAMDAVFGILLLSMMATQHDLRRRCASLANDRLFWCVATLLIFLGASVVWSPHPEMLDFVKAWLRIICCLCFILVVSDLLIEQSGFETLLYRSIAIGALLSAVICFALYLNSPPPHDRMQGLFRFNNPGKAGRIFCIALPFLAAGILRDRGLWRILAGIALISTAISLVLTGTRAAWLGGALGLFSYGLAIWTIKPTRFLAILVGCCAVAFGLGFLAIFQSSPEFKSALLPRGDSFRLGIWSAHIKEILAATPLYGRGLISEQWMNVRGQSFRDAHSMYLSVAGHVGIPGLLLFLTILIWTSIRLANHLNAPIARLGLSLVIAGGAVFCFNGDRIIDKVNIVWFALWFPVAVSIAMARQLNRPNLSGDSIS